MRYLAALALIFLLTFLGMSCGDKGVPPTPDLNSRIQIISGNNQTPRAGAFLPDSFLIRVTTSSGIPVPGIQVTYEQITPVNNGYFVWNTSRTTDSSGYAKNKYYADELVGLDSIKVTASGVDDSIVYFVLNVIPDDPDTIYQVSGNKQIAIGGQKLPNPCVVRVDDKFGNPIPNQLVWFETVFRSLVETDSSVSEPRLTDSAYTYTGSNGQASAEWILTVNPTPYIGGWPNITPTMVAYTETDDTTLTTPNFTATAYNPGVFEYYYDVRDIFEEHCFQCHAGATSYDLDFFYRVSENGNLDPPDSSAPLLYYLKPDNHFPFVENINYIEEDIVINWVVAHDTAHGSSGLNNYNDQMKSIFDISCATAECHTIGAPQASIYDLSSFTGLRGGGNDAVDNAIPGDPTSLLAQVLESGGSMRSYLGADSAALADSIINWIVLDSIRQY